MTKPDIKKLGGIGLMIDSDPVDLPDNAFTDALNVRFNGREIAPYLGNALEPYYTTDAESVYIPMVIWKVQPILFDGFSNGAYLLFYLALEGTTGELHFCSQNMDVSTLDNLGTAEGWNASDLWLSYKGQVNNCPFFGVSGQTPLGKQYNWTGFDTLTGWGEQTGGDQVVVERRWTCKNLIAFDNRLLALNTREESAGGVDVPNPNRIRWSGFAQENAFPINWDDTAANRTPDDFAAAVIDGYAGWQDLSSGSQLVDACENGGTLYVYTERETFSLTPSGNAQAPFIVKKIYSDLGCLDLGCVVNAHGYNYVFTGSDVVRHDNVSWKSIADGACRDYLADITARAQPGMVRMFNYPELSEIWVMCYGKDQEDGDYAKTTVLTFNYISQTWGRKTVPYIYDAAFCPLPLPGNRHSTLWDEGEDIEWDGNNIQWDESVSRIAQGVMVGSCAAGGIWYLNLGLVESRHEYSGDTWVMKERPLQVYVERRGMEFDPDRRFMISESFLNGRGENNLTVSIGYADNPDASYRWESQQINLAETRRLTWRAEGGVHGYRMELAGTGNIPGGIKFTVRSTGR